MVKMAAYILAAVVIFPALTFSQAEEQADVTPAGFEIETVVCTGIEERMPVGEADSFPADVEKVYLWTRVTGVTEGEIVIHHVWLREGEEMADVELPVKGSPWRVWSYKTIPSEWAGNWEVKVVGPDGDVMKSIPFTVGVQSQVDQPEGE
jgi:hypothetical protein